MSGNPRRWFQIHLSTAIVMMFVAGGLLGANLTKRILYYDDGTTPGWRQCGWPWPCWTEVVVERDQKLIVLSAEESWRMEFGRFPSFNSVELACDVAVGTVVVVLSACAMELMIRRREAQKL